MANCNHRPYPATARGFQSIFKGLERARTRRKLPWPTKPDGYYLTLTIRVCSPFSPSLLSLLRFLIDSWVERSLGPALSSRFIYSTIRANPSTQGKLFELAAFSQLEGGLPFCFFLPFFPSPPPLASTLHFEMELPLLRLWVSQFSMPWGKGSCNQELLETQALGILCKSSEQVCSLGLPRVMTSVVLREASQDFGLSM